MITRRSTPIAVMLAFGVAQIAIGGAIRDLGQGVAGLFMNNSGVVAGFMPDPSGPQWPYSAPLRAFVNRGDSVTLLDPGVVPVHVADDGRVIDGGTSMTGSGSTQAHLYKQDVYLAIANPNSGNDRGQIIGAVSHTDYYHPASNGSLTQTQAGYVFNPSTPNPSYPNAINGTFQEVHSPVAGIVHEVYPNAINNAGVIAGGAMVETKTIVNGQTISDFSTHAFVGDRDLTDASKSAGGGGGYSTAEVYALNDKGDAAGLLGGRYLQFGGIPFFYRDGVISWIPAPLESRPGYMASWQALHAMNNNGLVVGQDEVGNGSNWARHAILYNPALKTTIDLNSLLPKASGWELGDAVGINDRGQVLGYGSYNGEMHGFVLDLDSDSIQPAPVPEPTTFAILCAAGGCAWLASWRRGRRLPKTP